MYLPRAHLFSTGKKKLHHMYPFLHIDSGVILLSGCKKKVSEKIRNEMRQQKKSKLWHDFFFSVCSFVGNTNSTLFAFIQHSNSFFFPSLIIDKRLDYCCMYIFPFPLICYAHRSIFMRMYTQF